MKPVLCAHIVSLSEADVIEDAILEWDCLRVVNLPVGVKSRCPCGVAITHEYHLENLYNGNRTIVGSTCIAYFTEMAPDLCKQAAELRKEHTHATCWRCKKEKPLRTGGKTLVGGGEKAFICARCSNSRGCPHWQADKNVYTWTFALVDRPAEFARVCRECACAEGARRCAGCRAAIIGTKWKKVCAACYWKAATKRLPSVDSTKPFRSSQVNAAGSG